jgi:hypothetical protein
LFVLSCPHRDAVSVADCFELAALHEKRRREDPLRIIDRERYAEFLRKKNINDAASSAGEVYTDGLNPCDEPDHHLAVFEEVREFLGGGARQSPNDQCAHDSHITTE